MLSKPKAILIAVNINNQNRFKESVKELHNLAEACNFEVVGEIEQNLKTPNVSLYIGKGKAEEVQYLINHTDAEILIFNNELSPSQLKNLEKLLDKEILDRTALILEIFATRAKTKEAKLQVEIARLQYMLPRIIGAGSALSRQGGGTGGAGIRSRGSGEKKLELDRRKIEDKIVKIKNELKTITNNRLTQRKKRKNSNLPMISLVGYTNAGKSSLLNAMLECFTDKDSKKVFEKNMLFATLDTSVREILLPNNKHFLISDTVGFVSNLPHNLVKAFRSTLEEVCEADLLLHVIDCSDENYEHHIEVTKDTLAQIGAENIPTISVYNKADLTNIKIPFVSSDNEIYMSATKKIGLENLIALMQEKVFEKYVDCRFLIPYTNGSLLGYLNNSANVKSMKYENEGVLMHVECNNSDFERFQEFLYLGD
ncbi:GTPase HflX [Clostridium sp. 'deep sea']|uniref:GTPase HflX n=1 Tax=Clostridium sp. 'deep sea' TaxID=2779445 RepID=UPI0018966773|nr:GTPase HflX [Clostridium sp. 'deep sea']QOR35159.1 GTPase HflX [Clostridium sp. 'deep sea']